MSELFTGVTFAHQKVSPSDDAIVRRAILPDGRLTGCEMTYSGSTLTMEAGQLMVCGRQIRNPSAQNWAVVDATSGFARLVLTVDLTRTSTKEVFDQVVDSIEYASAADGFVALEQSDINASGTRYQVEVCVVSLGAGGITGIVSQLAKCAIDGSGGLNFKVVGGTTQPADPKENTIWVNTSEPITGFYFAREQPEGLQDGDIWIRTGVYGPVTFQSLKKNGIRLQPEGAKQRVNGSMTARTAWIYHNGAWVQLRALLLGGGVNRLGTPAFSVYSADTGASLSGQSFAANQDGSYTLKAAGKTSWVNWMCGFPKGVDLTGYTSIKIAYRVVSRSFSGSGSVSFQPVNPATGEKLTEIALANASTGTGTSLTKTVDAGNRAGCGLRFEGIYSTGDSCEIKIESITLE